MRPSRKHWPHSGCPAIYGWGGCPRQGEISRKPVMVDLDSTSVIGFSVYNLSTGAQTGDLRTAVLETLY